MYPALRTRLLDRESIVIDGGTGTAIQALGAPMHGETWCAEVNLTHPHLVMEAHRAYLDAGADLLIANTFATSPLLFNHLGRDADVARIDAAAAQLAYIAAGGRVPIGGSFSTMRPVVVGGDRTEHQREWPEAEARRLFAAKAASMVASGVDLIVMEMMRDDDYSLWATEAAKATGLPVWVGLAVERTSDGELTGFGRPDRPLAQFAGRFAALEPDLIAVMHTSPNDTDDALVAVKQVWDGPLGAYPESGYFAMPDWVFEDVISPAALVDAWVRWKALGVTVIGGCCGVGPEHIRALTSIIDS